MIEKLVVAVPKKIIDRSGIDCKDFERITGIKKTRRFSLGNVWQLVVPALEKFRGVEGIEQIIVVTQSRTRNIPAMAIDVLSQLNLNPKIPVFDVNQSCSGFIYGLYLSCSSRRTLVVCADCLELDDSELIFSDAACVFVFDHNSPLNFSFHNDPNISALWADTDGYMRMDGGKVFDFVTKNIPPLIRELPMADYFCQHQANESMMKLVAKRAGYTDDQNLMSIHEYGNQSMVSIPTCLAYNEQKILGKEVLLAGYGAGFSAALTTIKWPAKSVSTIIEV